MTIRSYRPSTIGVGVAGALLAIASPAQARQPDRDVEAFVARRAQCDHFRGEDPYDAARARFLARQLRRFCKGTDRELAALRRRHAPRPAIIARLRLYETTVE